jgi:hypothetical protein
VKLNINPVEVHPQMSSNMHPMDGFTFPLPAPNVIPSGYLTGMHWKFEKENGGAFPKIEHPSTQQGYTKHSGK